MGTTHALVTSKLEYCKVLYMGLFLNAAWKLQLVQNAAAHLLLATNRLHHVTLLLQELHLVPVAFCVKF